MKRKCTPSVEKMEVLLDPDSLTEALRMKVKDMIFTLVDAELADVLAALPYERTLKRQGYRNGNKERGMINRDSAYLWRSSLMVAVIS